MVAPRSSGWSNMSPDMVIGGLHVYKCSCFSRCEINSWDGRVVMGTGPLEGIATIL